MSWVLHGEAVGHLELLLHRPTKKRGGPFPNLKWREPQKMGAINDARKQSTPAATGSVTADGICCGTRDAIF